MTKSRSAFAELDIDICGTVLFDGGSMVCIEGCSTMVYVGKTGEYHILTSIYFIPRLIDNIISVG